MEKITIPATTKTASPWRRSKLEGGERLAAGGGDAHSLLAGERAAFEGEMVEHREYGRQIRVSWVESIRPESLDGIEKYLASGLIRGVGAGHGPPDRRNLSAPRTLDVLEAEPHRLDRGARHRRKARRHDRR